MNTPAPDQYVKFALGDRLVPRAVEDCLLERELLADPVAELCACAV
jgi:hypothetical protein